MEEIIVRCPFCVLDNDFRPMLSIARDRYTCTSCGHITVPRDQGFQCQCGRCTHLRARVTSAPQPQFCRQEEPPSQPISSPRLLSAASGAGSARSLRR